MAKFNDLAGQKFGRLTVVGLAKKSSERINRGAYWSCLCDCGSIVEVRSDSLKSGVIKSCGCYHKECAAKTGKMNTTKRMRLPNQAITKTRIYRIWKGMKYRCYNPKSYEYKDYGGRDISICGEWLNDSVAFYNWALTHGYKPGLTIERKDVNGNYCPENCIWATSKEQCNNRRTNVFIEFAGERLTIQQWSERTGFQHNVILQRLKRHWPPEKILTTSPRKKKIS